MLDEISVTGDKVLIDGYKHIDLPIGTIIMNAGDNGSSSFGSAFLLCDGSSKSVSAYPELSAVLNFKYGGSSGSGSFNLPNFLDRFPMGLLDVNGTQIANDPSKSPSTRQGGNSVIQSNQFFHEHSSLENNITAAYFIGRVDKCDNDDPRINSWVGYTNLPDTTTTISPSSHDPPYYTLNYFIYTGKGVIG
jgi:microcystin-dependent protein